MCPDYTHHTLERLAQVERQIRTIIWKLHDGQPQAEILQQVNDVCRQLDELAQGLRERHAADAPMDDDINAEQFEAEWASFQTTLKALTER